MRVFQNVVEKLSTCGMADRAGSQLAGFPAEDLIAELLGFLKILRTRRADELLAVHLKGHVPDASAFEDPPGAVGGVSHGAGICPKTLTETLNSPCDEAKPRLGFLSNLLIYWCG